MFFLRQSQQKNTKSANSGKKRPRLRELATKAKIPAEILSNPYEQLKRYRQLKKDVLDYMLWLSVRYSKVYPDQGVMAIRFGCTRETICRIIKQLKDDGLLISKQRFNTSSIYRISSWFFKPPIRRQLSKMFPALAYLNTLALMVAYPPHLSETNCNKSPLFTFQSGLSHTTDVNKDLLKKLVYKNDNISVQRHTHTTPSVMTWSKISPPEKSDEQLAHEMRAAFQKTGLSQREIDDKVQAFIIRRVEARERSTTNFKHHQHQLEEDQDGNGHW